MSLDGRPEFCQGCWLFANRPPDKSPERINFLPNYLLTKENKIHIIGMVV